MNKRQVKDLMIPLHEYALVSSDATLQDAIRILREAHVRRPSNDRLPPRAVLVADADNRVIGQVEMLDILKALEPKYSLLGDISSLSRAGVSDELISSVTDNLSFWQGDMSDACRRVRTMKISEIMHPLKESIDENASLTDGIHKIVMWHTMRILVSRKGEIVGVLRLADLFGAAADCIDTED